MNAVMSNQELRRLAARFIHLRTLMPTRAWPHIGQDVFLVEEDGPAGSLLFACRTEQSMSNPMGIVHGGVTAALVDSCMGITCGIQCGLITPTISMTINYARPVPLDASIVVRTRTVRCGATAGHIEAEVYPAGQPETLLVTASGAYSTKPNNLSGGRAPWEEEPAP